MTGGLGAGNAFANAIAQGQNMFSMPQQNSSFGNQNNIGFGSSQNASIFGSANTHQFFTKPAYKNEEFNEE